MPVYLLKQVKQLDTWDEYDAQVVCAKTETDARKIANKKTGDEGKIWEDPAKVTAEIVNTRKRGLILASFNAA